MLRLHGRKIMVPETRAVTVETERRGRFGETLKR